MSYYMNIKTNALENEKVKVTEKEQKYEGDCVDENVALSDDIVIKIIEKVDSSLDINFVNKFDEIDENSPVSDSVLVRKWGDKEWHKPTREYLGLED